MMKIIDIFKNDKKEEVHNDIKGTKKTTISIDNKIVNEDVTKEDLKIPPYFDLAKKTPVDLSKEEKHLIKNGRVYIKVGNGFGMYADNNEIFKL